MYENLHWQPKWKITKYLNDEDKDNNKPYAVDEFDGNMLLSEGIGAMLTLLIGGAETAFSNANAQLGVGNSTVATATSQTDLQGASTAWKAMSATYPQVSGRTVTFVSEFGSTEANFAWAEFSVRNGAGADKNLNRRVADKGTKSAGETWTLTLTITIT